MSVTPWQGSPGTFMRPLKKNVKKVPRGWELTDCPKGCGQKCYKTPQEPDPLPQGCDVACSECALKREKKESP